MEAQFDTLRNNYYSFRACNHPPSLFIFFPFVYIDFILWPFFSVFTLVYIILFLCLFACFDAHIYAFLLYVFPIYKHFKFIIFNVNPL